MALNQFVSLSSGNKANQNNCAIVEGKGSLVIVSEVQLHKHPPEAELLQWQPKSYLFHQQWKQHVAKRHKMTVNWSKMLYFPDMRIYKTEKKSALRKVWDFCFYKKTICCVQCFTYNYLNVAACKVQIDPSQCNSLFPHTNYFLPQ